MYCTRINPFICIYATTPNVCAVLQNLNVLLHTPDNINDSIMAVIPLMFILRPIALFSKYWNSTSVMVWIFLSLWYFKIKSFHRVNCLALVASTGWRVKNGGNFQNSGGVNSKLDMMFLLIKTVPKKHTKTLNKCVVHCRSLVTVFPCIVKRNHTACTNHSLTHSITHTCCQFLTYVTVLQLEVKRLYSQGRYSFFCIKKQPKWWQW